MTLYVHVMRRILNQTSNLLKSHRSRNRSGFASAGLFKNQPFYDGSHKTTREEEEGKTYEYDAQGHRHEIWSSTSASSILYYLPMSADPLCWTDMANRGWVV